MLKRIFTKPSLELLIKGKALAFKSPDEFEFLLAARSSIPLTKITKSLESSTGDLQLELNANIIAIEKINELLGQSPEISGELNMRLKLVNVTIFSKDNDWRDIFMALKQHDSYDSSQYIKITLKKYVEYLYNRKALIEHLLQKHQYKTDTNAGGPSLRTGELDLSKEIDLYAQNIKPGMNSMPKGEPIEFNLNEKEKIILLLAKYPCEVVSDNGIKFIDQEGTEYPVEIGMTKIGRGKECSIRFPDTMTLISRLHMKIFNHDNQRVELVDLSTCGTHFLKTKIQ